MYICVSMGVCAVHVPSGYFGGHAKVHPPASPVSSTSARLRLCCLMCSNVVVVCASCVAGVCPWHQQNQHQQQQHKTAQAVGHALVLETGEAGGCTLARPRHCPDTACSVQSCMHALVDSHCAHIHVHDLTPVQHATHHTLPLSGSYCTCMERGLQTCHIQLLMLGGLSMARKLPLSLLLHKHTC